MQEGLALTRKDDGQTCYSTCRNVRKCKCLFHTTLAIEIHDSQIMWIQRENQLSVFGEGILIHQ